MNIISLKNILFKKEYQLYELLKLKKNLENRFLRNQLKLSYKELKFKFNCVLITRKISFLYVNEIVVLIKKIETQLFKNFSSFKNKGKVFKIENISLLNQTVIPVFFDQLALYNEKLEKYNANLIVQGSYADGTQISYSDLDLVIIGYLSKEIIEIKKEIERDLLQIDSLQHHGVFFINKDSFCNYWQMDLPIETLKKALILSKTSSLEINISYYFKEKVSSYIWVSNFLNNYPILPITLKSGVFFVKYFISQLLLVPALLLATKGNYIYKRESFSLTEKYYSNEGWQCIEIASSIRKRWNQKNIDINYKVARENTAMKNVKEFNTFSEVVDIDNEQIDDFSKKYDLFVNETKELLNKFKNEI